MNLMAAICFVLTVVISNCNCGQQNSPGTPLGACHDVSDCNAQACPSKKVRCAGDLDSRKGLCYCECKARNDVVNCFGITDGRFDCETSCTDFTHASVGFLCACPGNGGGSCQ